MCNGEIFRNIGTTSKIILSERAGIPWADSNERRLREVNSHKALNKRKQENKTSLHKLLT